MRNPLTCEEIRNHSIDSNDMNENLQALYEATLRSYGRTWRDQYDAQTDPEKGDYPANPYFITAQTEYCQATRRIMLVGQETYSWGGEFGDCGGFSMERNVKELMSLYDICVKNRRLNTPLWRFGRHIGEASSSQVLFNNVAKVGWCGKQGFSHDLQPRILQEEIAITKPSMLILSTGPTPRYMQELENNGICPLNRTALFSKDGVVYAEVWEGLILPTVWCYHPRLLNTKKIFNPMIDKIADYILTI